MLVRDLVGEKIKKEIEKTKSSEVELQTIESNNDFFNALISKISSELETLKITKDANNLAEIIELLDWVQITLGVTKINDLIELRKQKLGLYWKRYYLKDNTVEDIGDEYD